uniref:Chromatin-remodeling ATPase INO80 n=1 Tax=Culicoides sonorensis TaxID=179676 RepID=A0A336MQW6_CULSO
MEANNLDPDESSYIRALEAALDLGPFTAYAQKVLNGPIVCSSSSSSSSSSAESDSDEDSDEAEIEKRKQKQLLYNFSNVRQDRQWLKDMLLSDTSSSSEISDEDDYVKEMLKNHIREKRIRERYHQNSSRAQYGYYSASILSKRDVYEEHRQSVQGNRRRKRKERMQKPEKPGKVAKVKKQSKLKNDGDDQMSDIMDPVDWEEHINDMTNLETADGFDSNATSPLPGSTPKPGMRGRRKSSFLKTPEALAARRRKIWQMMSKKEVGKVQRAKVNNHKELVTGAKRVATLCMKSMRHKAMQSQKVMKETMWRAKRLTREMQSYWKRYDRVERETKRRMEKEAEEQRKMDVELIEAKRQQRKLNFLITQTELYAHFMSKKLGSGTQEEQLRILSQLDEEANPRLANIDDYDSEMMKVKAQKNASDAYLTERARTKLFDTVLNSTSPVNVPQIKTDPDGRIVELPQPAMFKGKLKGYQIKGMTWLANLYDQGISGILADEMGLGKTVQSIALLCHIAENFGVWGPFLIISPASTLHNWQQEMERFVPSFRVVPYWGSPNERKILRQFWEQKDLHTKDASFHVVITSYQLVVSDYKYFNRIKWQYMVLDEAQAIKSSSSVRWKLLLGFNCRNRLLLSGTPIQNSMAELWALLHFIMPTLFDSHEEFNEWFSKDIESHAENKTGIDEKQISRLHMILKPFMLRRIKKDVENELSDKIEIMVYCPLTTRQRLLYMALKKKIRIEDLLQYSRGSSDGHHDKTVTSNLMNLVMQFRKVCNHPELFERRDSKSPYAMKGQEYPLPRLIFNEAFLEREIPSKKHLLYNKFSIYKAENVHKDMFPRQKGDKTVKYCRYVDLSYTNAFGFAGITDLTPGEIEKLTLGGLIYYFQNCKSLKKRLELLVHRRKWWSNTNKKAILLEPSFMQPFSIKTTCHDSILHELLFTAYSCKESTIYTHTTHLFHSMPESMEHRIIRSKHQPFVKIEPKIEEIVHETRLRSPMKSPTKSPIKSPANLNQQLTIKTPNKTAHNSGPKSPNSQMSLLPEFSYRFRPPALIHNYRTEMPSFVSSIIPRIQTRVRKMYCESREAAWLAIRWEQADNRDGQALMSEAIDASKPPRGWSNIQIPDKQTLVSDAGKLAVLDSLLTRLKAENHRVLIYSQMTKMIDLLEEYMWHRKHRYMRLDGSSKISARRDMVADFQTRQDIFVFLLSTRAGGLGINLTAADTVSQKIFN